ncbi:MAG: putative Ig domain-containing protein [Burkholderiales bacterium]|nr:putative Ig domain-containing protein [Burkholderiales bacterium]
MLPGVAPDDVLVRRGLFARNPGVTFEPLTLTIKGTSDVFTDFWFFLGERTGQGNAVEEVRFADGTVWNMATLRLKALEGSEESDRNGTIVGLRGYDDSDDFIDGRGGDDLLEGLAGNDTLVGGPGWDDLIGGSGDDVLLGGEGSDTLRGGTGADRLDGGPGSDRLSGGLGRDVIVLGRDSGNDFFIFEDMSGMTVADMDTVEIAPGVSPDEVRVLHTDRGLRISIAGGGGTITDPYFSQLAAGNTSGPYAIQAALVADVRFADGTVWDREALKRLSVVGTDAAETIYAFAGGSVPVEGRGGNDTLSGSPGNDVLDGGAGDDTLRGSAGADVLRGGEGADLLDGGEGDDRLEGGPGTDRLLGGAGRDTYVWRRGSGGDWIEVPAAGTTLAEDAIEIGAGLALGKLIAYRWVGPSDNAFVIADSESDAWLAIRGQGQAARPAIAALPRLHFIDPADGWTWDELLDRVQAPTDAADRLTYSAFDDNVYALGGDDFIDLGGGNDRGYGNAGDDTLVGGPGDDWLYGGEGADTYLFARGFGHDFVADGGSAPGAVDVVRFFDVASADVQVARGGGSGTEQYLTVVATADRLDLGADAGGIEQFWFSDGVVAQPVRAKTAYIAPVRARENEPFSWTMPGGLFSDPDGLETLTYSFARSDGGPLPGGLAMDPRTGTLAGTPTGVVSPGYFDWLIVATDPLGFSARQTLRVLLLGPNTPPVAKPIPDQAALEDRPFEFTLPYDSFAERDAFDSMTYKAERADGTALPWWLAFDPYARRFRGTPRNDDVGTIALRVTATDSSGATATSEFTLTVVNTNDPPYVASVVPARRIEAGSSLDFAGPAFGDPDKGDAIVLTARLSGGSPLPDWLSFDPATGWFSGAVPSGLAMRESVEVVATDRAGAATASAFDIQVDATDGAWRARDDALVVDEDGLLAIDPATLLANDLDAGVERPIALRAAGNARNGTVVFQGDRVVFRPSADFGGLASFDYTAADGDGGVSIGRVAVTVRPQPDAPRIARPLAPLTVYEDDALDVIVPTETFFDPDGTPNFTYSATMADGSALPSWLWFDPYSRELVAQPDYSNGGTHVVRIGATDPTGLTGFAELRITVLLTSIVGTAGDDVLVGGSGWDRLYGLGGNDRLDGGPGGDWMRGGPGDDVYVVDNVSDSVYEAPGEGRDRIEASVSYALCPDVEILALTGMGPLWGYGTPANDLLLGNNGANTLFGYAGDDVLDGGPGDDTLYGGDATAGTGNDTYRFGPGYGRDRVIDSDSTPGNVDRIEIAAGVTTASVRLRRVEADLQLLVGAGADRITVANWFGSAASRVERVDFADGTSWDADRLARAPRFGEPGVNDTIYVHAGGDDWFLFGRGFGRDVVFENYQGQGSGTDTVVVEAGLYARDLSLARNGNDLVLSIRDSTDSLTLKNWFAGPSYEVERVEFANGRVWDTEYLRALGSIPNRAPTVAAPVPDQSATEGTPFLLAVPAGAFADSDRGDVLALAATLGSGDPLPGWLTFDPATATFYGMPRREDTGTIEIRLTATDDMGARASDAFTITVAPSNRAPIAGGWRLVVAEDSSVLIAKPEWLAHVMDPDGDAVDLVRLGDASVGNVSIGEGQGILFAPPADYNGPATFTYTVTDGALEATGVVRIDILAVDDAPFAHPELLAPQLATEDVAFAYALPEGLFGDVDSASLSVSATLADGASLPSWLGFDADRRRLAGTPTYADGGALVVRLSASDGTGSAFADLQLDVRLTSIVGTPANDRLNGTPGADKLAGLAGADILDGKAGADTMIGGPGNDTYYVDTAGDTVIESPGEGTDRVYAAIDYSLPGNVENLTLTGVAVEGYGNDLANAITGNARANRLFGGGGADTLNGGAGADLMAGGPGNDVYYVDDPGDLVVEAVDEGIDRVQASMDYALPANVENLTLAGGATRGWGNALENTLTGNALDNELFGGDGADTLNGGPGADLLAGGAGDDRYFVDPLDRIVELPDGGADRVFASFSYALDDNVENLTLQGTEAIDGFGNAAANVISGNSAGNYIAGFAGNDSLSGGGGDDLLQGGLDDDSLSGGEGSNLLDGGPGNDVLAGGGGADVLIGGAGNDTLRPGTGANVVVFNRGDGHDTLAAAKGARTALSLGGGIRYEDLALERVSGSLVIHLGAGDKLTLSGWYQDPALQTVEQLQVIAEAMPGFVRGRDDALRDQGVERFDLRAIVARFDAARAAGFKGKWAAMSALLDAHLGGSDAEALGGDLAYRYGLTGSLAAIGTTAARGILGAPAFGALAQPLLADAAALGEGTVRLA